MKFWAVLFLAGICAVGAATTWAQPSTVGPSASERASFGQSPEDAYLSPTSYTNAHFGFVFSFPEGLSLHPVPEPASQDRRVQLLDLLASSPQRVAVIISAYEYKNKNFTDAKSLLRRALDQEVFSGLEQVHGLSKIAVGDRTFFYFEARKGVEQHALLAAELSGYVIEVELRSNNADVLRRLLAAFTQAEFFPPGEAQRHAGAQAAIYQGPAISEEHLRAIRESKPADHIAPGKISGTVYSNSQIGLTYEFPAGWSIEPEGAVEGAVEHYREKALGDPLLGARERAVVKACRRTLLSVWRTVPGPDGEVSYDEFGEVTLSAMPLSCFPNIRFPQDSKDATAVREFIGGLRFTQPLQRDMTEARTYEAGGKSFVLTRGMLAYKEPGDALSRRITVAMAMTRQRGYLLIWLFAAPHEAELRELMAANIAFEADSEPAATDVVQRGDGKSAAPTKLDVRAPAATSSQTEYLPSLQSGVSDELTPSGQSDPHAGGQPQDLNALGQGSTQKPPN